MSALEGWGKLVSVQTNDQRYRQPAVERAMKIQEVILRAMAGKLKWYQAAEIIGVSDRTMRRWQERYREQGYDGLFHRQRGRPSPKRVPVATVEEVLRLYQDTGTPTSTCGTSTRSWARSTASG